MNEVPIIEFKGITKRFKEVVANNDCTFSIAEGSIHGIVGENGAGKSTLMKILFGLYAADTGEILFKGKPTTIRSPYDAIALGIGMVHQHFQLVPTLPVWENVILGAEPTLGPGNHAKAIHILKPLIQEFGFSLQPDEIVEDLSVGHQQQVEILKLLYRQASVLILDEPTAVLTPQEIERLFAQLRVLRDRGKTIIIITHKLKEITQLTSTVTVMRQGGIVGNYSTPTLSEESLAELIIGRRPKRISLTPRKSTGSPCITIENLTFPTHGKARLENLGFRVEQGEIVGIAGVEGNGQKELIDVLSNIEQTYSGQVAFNGTNLRDISTYKAKQSGLGVIPADRLHEACVLKFDLCDNSILGHHLESDVQSFGWYRQRSVNALAAGIVQKFDVRPANTSTQMKLLSGGNQQKLVLGRELSRDVKFLIAANPTRGVDIGAIEFIYQQFLQLRDRGVGILLISSELDEILTLSDRILVLFEGQIRGETTQKAADTNQIGLWMTGGGR